MSREAAVKNWVYTLNNYDELEVHNQFAQWKTHADYCVMGFEVGESGTPHVQGCLVLKERKRFGFLKNLEPRAHWAHMMGTPKEAADYCKKDGNFLEFGTCPAGKAARLVAKQKEDWENIHRLAKSGDLSSFLEEHPQQSFLNMNKFKDLTKMYNKCPHDLPKLNNFWFMGDSGTGKSRTIRRDFPTAYVKPTATKWWPDYDMQEVVIIDDVGKEMAYVVEWLKNWADHYPFQAESKGNHTGMIRPKMIIVTSQYHWTEITDDPQLQAAIARRFDLIKFGKNLGEWSYENGEPGPWTRVLNAQPSSSEGPSIGARIATDSMEDGLLSEVALMETLENIDDEIDFDQYAQRFLDIEDECEELVDLTGE